MQIIIYGKQERLKINTVFIQPILSVTPRKNCDFLIKFTNGKFNQNVKTILVHRLFTINYDGPDAGRTQLLNDMANFLLLLDFCMHS